MIAILLGIAYISFMRKVEVDVMSNARFTYSGENGNATLQVDTSTSGINQRTEEFLKTVTYEVTPNSNLSNGNVVHVVASYDTSIAKEYNFKPIHLEEDVTVEGLDDQYESLKKIKKSYLKEILDAADSYLDQNARDIYRTEVNEKARSPKLEKQKVLYTAFMKSQASGTSDRVIRMYELTYSYEEEETTIYYMVCVPEINDGNEVQAQDIYGVKAYLTDDEIVNEQYVEYVDRLYAQKYVIEEITNENE